MSSLIASNDFFDWFTNSIWFSLAERRLLTLNPAFSACSTSATIIFSISSVDFCVSSASCLICCATTAKPAPASPALAASMLALSARSAVCLVIPLIIPRITLASSVLAVSSFMAPLTSLPISLLFFDTFSSCSILILPVLVISVVVSNCFLISSIIVLAFSVSSPILSVISSWFCTVPASSLAPDTICDTASWLPSACSCIFFDSSLILSISLQRLSLALIILSSISSVLAFSASIVSSL